MIAFDLALKSFLRTPRPNIAAMVALVSVLLPMLVLWSMKVGFIQSMMDELRSSPASLEIRVKGDYSITPDMLSRIASLEGVGFAMPTARYLASRAFASEPTGRNRTPVSLMPTGVGDPLIPDGLALQQEGDAILSSGLAEKMGLKAGDAFQIANSRRNQSEHMRIPLTVVGITSIEGISGNWVFVAPSIIADVEAFLDGYAVPRRGETGRDPLTRPNVHSGLRLYARDIEAVVDLAAQMRGLAFSVESNAQRIEAIRRLDRILSWIVIALAVILLIGLVLSIWSFMVVQLERLKSHIALLGLMGQKQPGTGLYFIFIGLFNALGGLLVANALALAAMALGNQQFRLFLDRRGDIFVLPMDHLALLNGVVLCLQLLLASFIAFQSSKIRPGDLFRDQ
ncbi:hypothetical protein FDK21_18965 [Cohaesibacter sp. CAU 1516]|uniref:hypothetical protein n=1 Tax=Cohaesibacter sp. CAU 1516 TaxID=2576038 RepID=UPI0010FCEDF7|nr:hypothetical protein [Cohaesibacter sp. CAU 1516]TLP42908.1 hypothetical protein FDK21_18965 [Cohaesibacter sp. CAU 1516]